MHTCALAVYGPDFAVAGEEHHRRVYPGCIRQCLTGVTLVEGTGGPGRVPTSSIGKSPKGKSLKPVILRKVTSSAPSVK